MVMLMIMVVALRHCQAFGGDTLGDDHGDGGSGKGDSDLHADHGGEDVGDCGGKRDGGDGGEGNNLLVHQTGTSP